MDNMHPERWPQIDELFHAAVELPPNERAEFLASSCKGDLWLRAEVEKLIDGYHRAASFIETPPELDETTIVLGEPETKTLTGLRLGAYKVIREIGRGGMGTVYLAARADNQFSKRVAIKVVTAGFDHETIIQRFRNERQILAGLDHPNIARLLDGGTTESGAPYFVMEYIEGETIREYCDSHRLTTMERLKLFRAVCAAVHFAHQNLIVHRDIKPGNILVTADGTAKLLDFGVAKLLSPIAQTSEITEANSRVLTPEYASPEQARGETITTASDVYSLGVLLYELLTGHRPYIVTSLSLLEMIEAICGQEPAKPSTAVIRTVTADPAGGNTASTLTPEAIGRARDTEPNRLRRELEGDLDNIVLKAMRKEPQRRYASVQEFAEDIRRHLEGLPVTASPDTFSYRAGKFVRRNRVAVVAATVAVITILSATGITAWQARVARRERDNAQVRFNQVRKLANSVVFEIHDSIRDLPGSTPARELLVTRALEYLDSLANEAHGDRSLQLELADAYDKIADVQGGFANSQLGQREKAHESYRRALAIREALALAEPGNQDFRRRLSTSYTKLGNMRGFVEVDLQGSLEFHNKALAINEQLATETPNDPTIRFDLGLSNVYVGYMLVANGRADEGLDQSRKGLGIIEELAAVDPTNFRIQKALAICYDRIAQVLMEVMHKHSEALSLYRKSQEISDRLSRADPLNTDLRRDVAISYLNVANASGKLGDTETALDDSRKALSIFVDLLSSDPQSEEFRQTVADVQAVVGEFTIKIGDAAAAIKLLNQSLLTLEKSFAASPTNETVHFHIANVDQSLGNAYLALASDVRTPAPNRLAEWREARSWFQKSREIYKSFNEAGKVTGDDAARLNIVTEEIATCESMIGRFAKTKE